MNETKRTAIYVRVSTADPDTDLHEAELKEYCERRGWTSVVYRDHGPSGATQDRQQH